MGFARPDGSVGVRNEVWIVPTVGCVNNIATAMAKRANAKVHGSVEEVIAFRIHMDVPRWVMIRNTPERSSLIS